MSKLFTVTVTYDYVVVAEDLEDAESIAPEYARDALHDLSQWDVECNVVEGVHAAGWDDDCIPYGGDGNTRTNEYLKKEV